MASRRQLLSLLGISLSAVSGCSQLGLTSQPSADESPPNDDPAETKTEQRQKNTHQPHELEDVVRQLEQDSVTLNFVVPEGEENAEYSNAPIYSEFNGELDVELNLAQAREQRHHGQLANKNEYVQEWINNITDEEWRNELLELDDTVEFDWDTYTDEDLSYEERMKQSNMWALWYVFESDRMGVSSDNNELKAAALQETERQAGFDTFIWDDGIPGHGLVHGIGYPTQKQKEAENQETYVIETDYGDSEQQQVAKWANSQYQTSQQHPAREEIEEGEEWFYVRTAKGKGNSVFNGAYEVSDDLVDQFADLFNGPGTAPAQPYLDRMAATMFILEEIANQHYLEEDEGLGQRGVDIEGNITLEEGEIQYAL
jgi:hypothetical protein